MAYAARHFAFTLILAGSILAGCNQNQDELFEIVLLNGRVMDPESGLDEIRNVGIKNGRISAITTESIQGSEVIDVAGLVVSPGFIDLHAHGQDFFSSSLQVRDGVTTSLELEGGVYPVDPWYTKRADSALINYGASVSHIKIRETIKHSQSDWYAVPASEEEVNQIMSLAELGLQEGALGIGLVIEITTGAEREEITKLFQLASDKQVPVYVHIRVDGLVGLQEVVANAAATGAALHVVHINSMCARELSNCLDMIMGGRNQGLDITTETYPYTAWSAPIGEPFLGPGWQEYLGADFGDLEWVATGERLTEETFNFYRTNEPTGDIIGYTMKDEVIEEAISHPAVMIASDGMLFVNGRAHPRGAGTFSRVLGRYVREQKVLPLMDALRKMTIAPAKRLESIAPQMRLKGRLQVGADADITVFDPDEILDNATFQEPAQPSSGILHVLVNGRSVVRNAELLSGVFPGREIRRPMSD